MTRRFMRSVAVVGTIGLTSLGADAAAAAVTTPVVHSATTITATENENLDDGGSPEPELVDLTTAAEAIGVTLPVLHDALHTDGATLADVARAHGVSSARLEAELVAEAARRLDTAVMAGHLSPWEVWERRAVLPDVVAAAVQADRSVEVA